jgi:hypothetical protein
MGARSEHEALGIFVHDVHRRWGSVFWRSWARVIRGRLPAIGRPNAEIRKRPWAGRSRGRRCTQASCGGCAPRRACERRAAAAGWQVALAAAKFARLRTLDWTLVFLVCARRRLEVPPLPSLSQDLRAREREGRRLHDGLTA